MTQPYASPFSCVNLPICWGGLLLGHASIQTTERYLGTQQEPAVAVNDAIGLEME